GVRIIARSRDAIGLGRVAGVTVAIDGMADAFAELLCELGSNCRFKEKPELKIAGARFHQCGSFSLTLLRLGTSSSARFAARLLMASRYISKKRQIYIGQVSSARTFARPARPILAQRFRSLARLTMACSRSATNLAGSRGSISIPQLSSKISA